MALRPIVRFYQHEIRFRKMSFNESRRVPNFTNKTPSNEKENVTELNQCFVDSFTYKYTENGEFIHATYKNRGA